MCAKQELFVNLGNYGYMTPAGCSDQTVRSSTRQSLVGRMLMDICRFIIIMTRRQIVSVGTETAAAVAMRSKFRRIAGMQERNVCAALFEDTG